MSGMLMCLDREQRLIYVLGDIFNINHKIGSEIFNVSLENYRKKNYLVLEKNYSTS